MFDFLYEWIQNIAFYMVLVTAVMHMIPNPDYKKYIRFFTGLVLILLIVTPILKIFGTDYHMVDLGDYQEYQKQLEEKMEEIGEIETEEQEDAVQVDEIEIRW